MRSRARMFAIASDDVTLAESADPRKLTEVCLVARPPDLPEVVRERLVRRKSAVPEARREWSKDLCRAVEQRVRLHRLAPAVDHVREQCGGLSLVLACRTLEAFHDRESSAQIGLGLIESPGRRVHTTQGAQRARRAEVLGTDRPL